MTHPHLRRLIFRGKEYSSVKECKQQAGVGFQRIYREATFLPDPHGDDERTQVANRIVAKAEAMAAGSPTRAQRLGLLRQVWAFRRQYKVGVVEVAE